jgi:hypothetical protein
MHSGTDGIKLYNKSKKKNLKLHNLGTFLVQIVVLLVKSISFERIFDLKKNKV